MKYEKEKRIVFPESGRTPEYQSWLQRILDSGECPFCIENWPGEHPNPYKETKYWIITENAVKSDKSEHHWLIICKRHLSIASELNNEEFIDLLDIYRDIVKEHDLEYLTLIMRSGNPATGSSVQHLHAQIIVSKSEEVNLTRI